MTEVKFPNTITVETATGIKFEVRPFILHGEMVTIVEQAKNVDNIIDRQSLVDILVARFCTNITILDSEEVPFEVVDLYRANGVFDTIYENIRKSDVELLRKALDDIDTPTTQLKGIRNDFYALFDVAKDYVSKIDLNAIQNDLTTNLKKLSTLDDFQEVKKLVK